jgi:hypothetical protein
MKSPARWRGFLCAARGLAALGLPRKMRARAHDVIAHRAQARQGGYQGDGVRSHFDCHFLAGHFNGAIVRARVAAVNMSKIAVNTRLTHDQFVIAY